MSRISQSFSFGDLSYRRREQVTDSYFSFPWALQEAVKKGERIPASYNNNWFFTYDFKKIIGTSNGKPTSKIRVILDENYYLRSAYPIQ